MKRDLDVAVVVDDVTRDVYTAKKAFVGAGTGLATVLLELGAAGVLHGTAQTVAQGVIAVLGIVGIHGSVYRTENTPKVKPQHEAA
jgi:hypothetical protein